MKVPSSGQAVIRVTKTSPQTSGMKVIMGKGQHQTTLAKGNKGLQVSGPNQYGPSENTRSQTRENTPPRQL